MFLKKIKLNTGFTLVEISTYITIFGILAVGLVSFGLSISFLNKKIYVAQEVQTNAQIALNLISQKISSASSTITPLPNLASTSLILGMNIDQDLIITASSGIITLTSGTSSPVNITSQKVSVTNLIFSNLSASSTRASSTKDSVKIEMTVEYRDAYSKEYEYSESFQTAVGIK